MQRISLVAASGVYSLLCVDLGAMACLVEEHKLKRHWLHEVPQAGSVLEMPRLNCSTARGIFQTKDRADVSCIARRP